MRIRTLHFVAAIVMLGVVCAAQSPGQEPAINLPAERRAAPAFPENFKWFNSERPLALGGDLKGRVVVLDFWTYCCINCMHNLANIEQVEEHFKDEPGLVFVGVHSNKFTNEGEAENIRQAILRYRIAHPVIVDEKMLIWNRYGVRSWPTVVFIDAAGQTVGSLSGEVPPETYIAVVGKLLAEGRAKSILAREPLKLKPEPMPAPTSGLMFPGKIIAAGGGEATSATAAGPGSPAEAAAKAGGRLFIADSGHNRLLESDLEGKVRAVVGSGRRGRADGTLAAAEFNCDPHAVNVAADDLVDSGSRRPRTS